MESLPRYYTQLFNGITDAIEALEAQNHIKAQEILIHAQQDAEEQYQKGGDPLNMDFPKYYHRLSEGVTDALKALQEQNYIKARKLLIYAQQDAEEMYLEDGDEDNKRPQYTTVDLTPIDTDAGVPAGELIILDRDKVLEKFRQITSGEQTPHPEAPNGGEEETE